MPGRKKTKKTTKKTKSNNAVPGKKLDHKEMRFSMSLVILIGMLTFSLLLLLLTLNKTSVVYAVAKKTANKPIATRAVMQKSKTQTLNDSRIDYGLTIPTQIGKWFYKVGQVKSPTDDSLSDQYLKILIPVPGSSSSNFDNQYQDVLTIRKFSADEWSDIQKACKKEKQDICEAGGQVIANAPESEDSEWVYAYTKSDDCPKNIEAKCALVDKILESFKLK
jgi:hypothetical protein